MKILLIALILTTLSLNQVHQVQATTLLTHQKNTVFKPKIKKDYILVFKKPIKKTLIINVLLVFSGLALLLLSRSSSLVNTFLFPFLLIAASILIVSGTVEIILDYILPLLIKN